MRTRLLTLTTCLLVLPGYAKYSGGTGEPNDPYQIATATDLIALGETPEDYDKHFILTADIDLDPKLPGRKVFDKAVIAPASPINKYPYVQGTPFTGVLDGKGHAISRLTIKGNSFLGLFGQLASGAEVKNLAVADMSITGSGDEVGGLMGCNGSWGTPGGTVTRCYSTGAVSGTGSVGGLVGWNSSGGTVTQCYSTAMVSGTHSLGGLVGWNGAGTLTQCYSTGAVSGTNSIGGLAGVNYAIVTQCYSTSAVSGSGDVGGLVGENHGTVTQCYSTGAVGAPGPYAGGLVGRDEGVPNHVTDCYWDTQTSGRATSAGGTAKTTSEMRAPATFRGWGICDDEGAWTIDDGRDYPRLGWENRAGRPIVTHLSDFLKGTGVSDSPYFIYTLQDLDIIGKFPCEQDKRFRLAFLAGQGTPENPYLIHNIDEINLLKKCPYEQDKRFRLAFLAGQGTPENPYLIHNIDEINLLKKCPYEQDEHFRLAFLAGQGTAEDPYLVDTPAEIDLLNQCPYDGDAHVRLMFFRGRGTAEDPYLIHTPEEFGRVGTCPRGWNAHFKLMGDLDLSAFDGKDGRPTFNIIGRDSDPVQDGLQGTPFTGVFDGNGHVISGFTFTSKDRGYVGLFGYASQKAQIKNVGLSGPQIRADWQDYVGTLVGRNEGTVTACRIEGGTIKGFDRVGGLVGSNSGVITGSYSTAPVTGDDRVGGLVGENLGTVASSFSAGLVSGRAYVGGLVGYGSVGAVTDCVWDLQTSGQIKSAGGTGKTTAQMQTAITFLNWVACRNQESVWTINDGVDYPRLRWENRPGEVIGPPTYGGGAGTAQDPYLIYTAAQLNMIGLVPCDWDKHFKLMADIDMSDFDGKNGRPAFNLIGPDTDPATWYYDQNALPFTGAFDGNGHTIAHLTIAGQSHLGLFCYLAPPAEIRNLGVVDVNIMAAHRYAGGLIGYNRDSLVSQCYSTGVVHAAQAWAGGLVGYNRFGTLAQCHSAVVTSSAVGVGGLAGESWGIVTDCYATGAVSGTQWHVGGLIGGNYGTVTHCYSIGTVRGTAEDVGGLVGVGGLGGVVNESFWNTETSGQITSAGGTGKTTAEMQTAKTFLDAGWDFVGETANGIEDIWGMVEGRDYPKFVWEQGRARLFYPPDGTADVAQPLVLRWGSGGLGLWHDVYLGEDRDAVANAARENAGVYHGPQPAEETMYDPGVLEWGRTYYWRVDEVNEADPNRSWKGSLWSFATADFTTVSVVDDFESYVDDMSGEEAIFRTWLDGFGCAECKPSIQGNGTGSMVGNNAPPFVEQQVIHGGKQSMPMGYSNVKKPWYSEAERTWATPQDWTTGGSDTLTLYFRGELGNSPESLYVGIEDSAGRIEVVVYPDVAALLATEWRKWHIALGEVRAAGVDVAAVKKMVIGVGDRENPKRGGTGRIYIDDIYLTKRMP